MITNVQSLACPPKPRRRLGGPRYIYHKITVYLTQHKIC